jgi:hypothetical protein
MAQVWLAVDHGEDPFTVDRRVALKILRGNLTEDPASVGRFEAEGRAMTRFRHEHIATVFAQERDGDTHFLVMEFVEGYSLARMLRERGPLPSGDAVEIASQVCSGIEYAHAHGVIHRDIKPGNVLLAGGYSPERPPRVKVTDFGIALAKEGTRLTRTDGVVGTPAYMAPEVALGEDATEAADVYGCGALLYQLVTGKVPYPGGSLREIAAEQLAGPPPPPQDLSPDVPGSLAGVVLVALSYRPEARFVSITDLHGAMEAALGGEDFSAFLPTRVLPHPGTDPATGPTLYRPVWRPRPRPGAPPPYDGGSWGTLVGYVLALGAILLIFGVVLRLSLLILALPLSFFAAAAAAVLLGVVVSRSPLFSSRPDRRQAAWRRLGLTLRGLSEAAVAVALAAWWGFLTLELIPQVKEVVVRQRADVHLWLYLASGAVWLVLGLIGVRLFRRAHGRAWRLIVTVLILAVGWGAAASLLPELPQALGRHFWPVPSVARRVRAETRRWEEMLGKPALRPDRPPPTVKLRTRLLQARDSVLEHLRGPRGRREAHAWLRSMRAARHRWGRPRCRAPASRLLIGPGGAKVICG